MNLKAFQEDSTENVFNEIKEAFNEVFLRAIREPTETRIKIIKSFSRAFQLF